MPYSFAIHFADLHPSRSSVTRCLFKQAISTSKRVHASFDKHNSTNEKVNCCFKKRFYSIHGQYFLNLAEITLYERKIHFFFDSDEKLS